MLQWLHSIARLVLAFLKLLARRFGVHQGSQNAAALTYTTLLSLVPLMTVVLALLSALPVADRAGELIQDFIFQNFVPAVGESIRGYLQEFSNNASKMSGIGFFFLLLVALMLMESIDRTLNNIWEVHKKRTLINKFMLYWVILSLGPIAMAASILATSYLITLPLLSEAAGSGLGRQVLALMPIGFSAVGFTLMYALVPNRHIRFRHALAGGLLAALLFELAKHGFGIYLTRFASYQAIYGAMAAIPIFLIWIYLSWLIVLLGAEFSHCLEVFRHSREGELGRRNRLADMLDVVARIGRRQEQGLSCSIKALSRRHLNVESLLAGLQQQHFVYETDDGEWVLARCLSRIRVYDIYLASHYRLPQPGEEGWPADARLAACFRRANEGLAEALATPMSEMNG